MSFISSILFLLFSLGSSFTYTSRDPDRQFAPLRAGVLEQERCATRNQANSY